MEQENKEERLQSAIEKAYFAFWEEIAKEFSEIKTGDLSPLVESNLNEAMANAAEEWVSSNKNATKQQRG